MVFKRLFFILIVAASFIPTQIFAHGTEEEHQQEMLWGYYAAIGSSSLFLLFLISYFVVKGKAQNLNVKKQEHRNKRKQLADVSKVLKWGAILTFSLSILIGIWVLASDGSETSTSTESGVTFEHIHGLGITSDGKEIYVPAHDGLRVYTNGQWSIPEGEQHDYMGFSMIEEGFYSSGHPAPGSSMPNPFGVIKSTDGGKSIEPLDLLGEVDFHGMAAGYRSHAIYVFNPEPNSKMAEAGMYYTIDETKTWIKSEMSGVNGTPTSLAVHPDKAAVIALGTEDGVYLSEDYGQTFEKKASGFQVTSLAFDSKGKLLIGAVQDKPLFMRYTNESITSSEDISIPPMEEDAVQYIAANPQNSNEIVITTFKKDIYKTSDAGDNWTQLANDGTAVD